MPTCIARSSGSPPTNRWLSVESEDLQQLIRGMIGDSDSLDEIEDYRLALFADAAHKQKQLDRMVAMEIRERMAEVLCDNGQPK